MSYGPEQFQADTHATPDQMARLERYAALLAEWNPRINLVANSTLADVWRRHILDSAQLLPLLPSKDGLTLADLGSGAGFPGLVLAILGAGDVTLFESDQRKAVFLREAARVTGTSVSVRAERLENAESQGFDVLTARAFAPLEKLLTLSTNLRHSDSILFLLKGQNVADELTNAHKIWSMNVIERPSRSDAQGTILQLSEVRRDTNHNGKPV